MWYHGSRKVTEVWWDRIYICIVNECVIWNHFLTYDVLLQILAHEETVLGDVLTRYVRKTKYFMFSCVLKKQWGTLYVLSIRPVVNRPVARHL